MSRSHRTGRGGTQEILDDLRTGALRGDEIKTFVNFNNRSGSTDEAVELVQIMVSNIVIEMDQTERYASRPSLV